MLVTSELVRDVLCKELISVNKCIEAQPMSISADMRHHLQNMANILMSDRDFVQVPPTTQNYKLREIAEKIGKDEDGQS